MKRLLVIYSAILLGIFTLNATPNTLYFMEYLPYQTMVNPALQPRCTTYVELPAISTISLYGNTGGLSLNDILYVKDGSLVTFLHPEYGNKDALYNKIMKSNGVDFEADISLLGFGFRVKEKGYVTINTSFRTDVSLSYPKELISLGLYGMPDTVNVNSYKLGPSAIVNSYIDLNGGYSEQINEKWTVGGRLHLLFGLANIKANMEGITLNTSEQQWNISGDVKGNMAIPAVNMEVDENGNVLGIETVSSVEQFLETYKVNIGASVDLGAVYKPIPELKISLSVKDLGFMVWRNGATSLNGGLDYTYNGLNIDSKNTAYGDSILSDLKETINFSVANGNYTTMMNGRIYAGVEYSFLKNMMSVGVVSKTSYSYAHWDEEVTLAYNLRPCSWFGLSASYSFISSGFNTLGLAFNLRLPPFSFYVASDYTPLHYSADGIPYKTSAFNVQAGLVLTFGCKKKKAVEETPSIIEEDVLPEPTQTEDSVQIEEPVSE